MRDSSTLTRVQRHQEQKEDAWVDSMIEVAHTATKLFARHTCRMCHVYVDEQLEFERQQQQFDFYKAHQQSVSNKENSSPGVSSPWANLVANAGPSPFEVELYRQFLFDEESVVDTVENHLHRNYDECKDNEDQEQQQSENLTCSHEHDKLLEDEEHTAATQHSN